MCEHLGTFGRTPKLPQNSQFDNSLTLNKKNVTKVDPDDDDTNVHRLVQDENAKTILLNFPLEVSVNEKDVGKAASNKKLSSPRYKFCYKSVL